LVLTTRYDYLPKNAADKMYKNCSTGQYEFMVYILLVENAYKFENLVIMHAITFLQLENGGVESNQKKLNF